MSSNTSGWQRFRMALKHPLDAMRQWRTKGFDISISNPQIRRGDDIEVLVTITGSARVEEAKVGLMCTECYAEKVPDDDPESDFGTTRQTSEAIAHEDWTPVDSAPGVHSVRLRIPLEAPFSYEGDCLSFKWAAIANGRRPGLNAQARLALTVAP
jgi:hypothetical protein